MMLQFESHIVLNRARRYDSDNMILVDIAVYFLHVVGIGRSQYFNNYIVPHYNKYLIA